MAASMDHADDSRPLADAARSVLWVVCALGVSSGVGGFLGPLVNGSFDLSFGTDLGAGVAGTVVAVLSGLVLRGHARHRDLLAMIQPAVLIVAIVLCVAVVVIGLLVNTSPATGATDRAGPSALAVVAAVECLAAWVAVACGRALYRRGRGAELPVTDPRT